LFSASDETRLKAIDINWLTWSQAEHFMAYYRVYSLDLMDRHIIDVHHFEANGDAAAISKVGCAALGVSRELWNLGRKVMDFAQ
jgi:hypothetical protein